MKRRFKDMEKIEKYLDNQVDEQERAEVNNRLVSDEEFRKLFDEMESLLEGIKHTGAKTTVEEKLAILEDSIHILEEDGEDESEIESKTIIVVWYNRPIYRAIAASFILIMVAVYAFGPFGTMSDDRLFAEYFEPQTNLQTKRGEETRRKAYAAYDAEDYQIAASLLIYELQTSDNQIVDRMYLGSSFLEMEDTEQAIKYFKEVININEGYALEAKWYLALSYLQLGARDSARTEFTEIWEANNDYSEDSREILNKMKK